MIYQQLCHRLCPLYDEREARAIVRTVLETAFGLSLTDIACGKVNELSADDVAKLEKMMSRLSGGEPVQYVLGQCDFCDRTFSVGPGVLIPRPETAELCRKIEAYADFDRILDIGTGSGCIAVTLALDLPGTTVEAWDVSETALRIAAGNACRLGAHVSFRQCDVLRLPDESTPTVPADFRWSLIVSNPPYIACSERAAMSPNVLEHEPDEALFVPDDDPLCFYRAIARYARRSLVPGGRLWLEINPRFADQLRQLVSLSGLDEVAIHDDAFGRHRFLSAVLSAEKQ